MLLALLAGPGTAIAAPGDTHLVVSRVANALTDSGQAVSLDRLDGTGVLDGAPWALPTAAAGAQKPFVLAGDGGGQGAVTRSTNGQYVVVAGFAATPGAAAVADSPTTGGGAIARVVARVGSTGTVDTSTTLGNAFYGEDVRGVATTDGTKLWVSGHGNHDNATRTGGLVYQPFGATGNPALVQNAGSGQRNSRTVRIVNNRLYVSSDKTTPTGVNVINGNLEETDQGAATNVIDAGSADRTPSAFVLLDRDFFAPGLDSAYVVVEGRGIEKFSSTDSGATWSSRGTIPGRFTALTEGVDSGQNEAELYAVAGDGPGNRLMRIEDPTGIMAAPTGATVTTIATAPGNSAFRGVAQAPAGSSQDVTSVTVDGGGLTGGLGDAGNPTATIRVAPDNATITPPAGVTITGGGATRTVTVTPSAIGYRDIVLDVDGGPDLTLPYAASGPSGGAWYSGASDLSAAIDVGGGYVVAANDEDDTLRLYRSGVSGAPVKTWDFDSRLGDPLSELDLEGASRTGDTITWAGSMSNSNSGASQPTRSVLFTTTVTGSGAATELAFGSAFTGLRQQLIAWDQAKGSPLGLAAAGAAGHPAKTVDGLNLEGFDYQGTSTSTAYLGMRAPIVAGKALLIPVTNVDRLLSGADATAVFGEPVRLDLGGLGVRDIRHNAAGQYLILAGSPLSGGAFALFTWDGDATHAPVRSSTVLPTTSENVDDPGSWETIASVPETLGAGAQVPLVMDNGSSDLYGDGAEAKDLAPAFRKSRAATFTLAFPSPQGDGGSGGGGQAGGGQAGAGGVAGTTTSGGTTPTAGGSTTPPPAKLKISGFRVSGKGVLTLKSNRAATVKIAVQRKAKGKWRTRKTVTRKAKAGKAFKVALKVKPGRYRLKVTVKAGASTKTLTKVVRVKRG